jgi:preprotein translocase subunit SecE
MAEKKNLSVESEKAEATKADKTSKPAKKKQPRVLPAVKKFFRDLKGEFKKIIWPTRQTLFRNTIVTLAMCFFVGLFVGLFDLGISAMVRLMLSL